MRVPFRMIRDLIELIKEIRRGNPERASVKAIAMARKEAQRAAARKALSNE